jgi:predicted ATPase/class 3 adenylate cyclase
VLTSASSPALFFDETCRCGRWYTFVAVAKNSTTTDLVAAMQEMADWLKKLGMPEYAERFAANDIEIDILPELTDHDLERLGVSLGHRRRILRAIRELGGRAQAESQAAAAAPARHDRAERRQLTVMFCDLVGSTALSVKLDPEDLRGIIAGYHRCCTELVERNGGFVARYMGDGVLAYFGYPQAHEHDAERAVRAGLNLVEAVPKLATNAGSPLQVRVGIATGLIVVGDLIGVGAAREQPVVGETPNLAARLQALAEPGAVVIESRTRRMTGGLFEYRDLGTVALKGFAEDVPAWQVLRADATVSRFEALHATTTPLVGRDEEIDLLLRRWDQAKRGEGCVVLLSGEPGIGKSRIAQTVAEQISTEPHTRLRYFCSPHHQDSALYPVITQLERAAGFRRDDSDERRLDKLEAILARATTDLSEIVPPFADWLSIPTGDRYPTLDLTPAKRREKSHQAGLAQVEGLAARHPLLMVYEDLHWSDPTTREGLDLLIDRVPTLRVLVVITFRPEFTPPWAGRSHVTLLSLNRLPLRHRAEMITHVTDGKILPKEIADQIIDRTDGIPLFIEELTKAVVESGVLIETGEGYRVVGPVAPLAIPTTLHASLLARLDRLAPTRQVAQTAAALGRSFSHELISAVATMPKPLLDDALAQLVTAELIFQRGTPPDAEYTFKHALVQDAAYGTLLREPKRALHARIAEALESQFAEVVESQPELLARHWTEAGLIEKAAPLWGKAGQRSLDRSALLEAIEQITRALDQMAALPGSPALRREQIKLQVALITPLIHVKGYAAPETKAAAEHACLLIEQAEALGEPREDLLLLFSALYGVWAANYVAFNGDALRELSMQFLALAEKQRATGPLMIGHRLMATSLVYTGKIAEGRAHYDQAMALYDPAEHRPLAARFGQDVRVVIFSMRSLALWLLGFPDVARTDLECALKDAREIGQAATLMYALRCALLLHLLTGNYATATAQAQELVALAEEKGALMWKAAGMVDQGFVLALTGNASDAIQMILSGITAWRSAGSILNIPRFLLHLERAYAELGQFEQAWRSVGEAMAVIANTKEKLWEGEVHRAAGEIALIWPAPDAAKAESCFERALTIARAQQAKSWELRAAMSMAQLWRDQGKQQQAHDLLAPVYGWFTQGFDTLDLKQAKALLDELQ